MSQNGPKNARNELIHESMDELRAKFNSDLSRWTQVRRTVSLKPTMGCPDCDATGKKVCSTCSGSGKGTVVIGGEGVSQCTICDGAGYTTCVNCEGTGTVENIHRKKVLIVLYVGIACWLVVMLQLWRINHDVLPALGTDIKGKTAPASNGSGAPMMGSPTPGAPGAMPGNPVPGNPGAPPAGPN